MAQFKTIRDSVVTVEGKVLTVNDACFDLTRPPLLRRVELLITKDGEFAVRVWYRNGRGFNAGRYTTPSEATGLADAILRAAG